MLEASQQVVAGINFQLLLKVSMDGKERRALATVWHQSWREPNPYELTAWQWQD